ncbi:MAG: hypothetical protein OSB12_03525 [Planctomycetota bacterium]|jgi:hypothetical protein|nr:hypothetical protein [Planctomycetota bacterium]
MTRLLIFCALLVTAVLLQALQARPPSIEFSEKIASPAADSLAANSSIDSTPPVENTDPQQRSRWTAEQKRSIEERLTRWSPIEISEFDLAGPSPEDQLLLLESICQQELTRLGQQDPAAAVPLLTMRLKGGSTLAYRSLQIRAATVETVLPSGLSIRIPTSRIEATQVTRTVRPAATYPSGSLVDTISILDSIGRQEPIDPIRWRSWLEQGGPVMLARLIPTDRSKPLRQLSRIAWRSSPSEVPEVAGKSKEQLNRWIASIRSLLREGFPSEQRVEVLEQIDQWQQWLDLQVLTSQNRYQQISLQLRLLKLDILKSTGF